MVVVDLPFEIIVVIVALALLLAYYANRQMYAALLQGIADNVPVVGGALSDRLGAIISGIADATRAWVDTGVTPLAHLIAAPVLALDQLIERIVVTFLLVAAGIERQIVGHALAAVAHVTDAVNARVDQLTASLSYGLQQAYSYALIQAQAVASQLGARIDAVEQSLLDVIAVLEARLHAQVIEAVQGVEGEVRAAEQEAARALSEAERATEAMIEEAERIADEAVQRAFKQAEEEIATETRALQQGIADALTVAEGIGAELHNLSPQLQALLHRLTPDILTCIEEMCGNLRKDIPNLKDADNLIAAGIFAALVTSAVTEPDTAAEATEVLIVDPVNAVMHVVGALAGVRGTS